MYNIHLSESAYTFGKSPKADGIDIDISVLGEKCAKLISNTHFEISRNIAPVNRSDPFPVYIKDLSTNGTFVNKELIGKGQQRILVTGDVVSVLKHHVHLYEFTDYAHTQSLDKEINKKYYTSKLPLGYGAYGTVYKAYDLKTCEKVAIKRMRIDPFLDHKTETDIMEKLRHPCIVELFEVMNSGDYVHIVMECMAGGSLTDRLRKKNWLTEFEAKVYFLQMAKAVEYMHGLHIAHRDLKPGNILLASNEYCTQLKITDFGISKIEKGTRLRSVCGTTL